MYFMCQIENATIETAACRLLSIEIYFSFSIRTATNALSTYNFVATAENVFRSLYTLYRRHGPTHGARSDGETKDNRACTIDVITDTHTHTLIDLVCTHIEWSEQTEAVYNFLNGETQRAGEESIDIRVNIVYPKCHIFISVIENEEKKEEKNEEKTKWRCRLGRIAVV